MIAALVLVMQLGAPTLVPGTANTWTDGTQIWAGNPFCAGVGAILSPTSPAIDAGALIQGFHCPNPGSALNQPRMSNGDYCQEWYGSAPDIGACEYVPAIATIPNPPSDLVVQ